MISVETALWSFKIAGRTRKYAEKSHISGILNKYSVQTYSNACIGLFTLEFCAAGAVAVEKFVDWQMFGSKPIFLALHSRFDLNITTFKHRNQNYIGKTSLKRKKRAEEAKKTRP